MSKKDIKEIKSKLSTSQINYILDFITPNPYIPEETALCIVQKIENKFRSQLERIEIYPSLIDTLKSEMKNMYLSSLAYPGENVGIITAQSIGEKQTQSNLNTFHKAGSSEKQPVVSKFSELLNATNKPKAPTFFVYFNKENGSVTGLRNLIKHSIVNLSLKKICLEWKICLDKEEEPWYNAFYKIFDITRTGFTDCLSLKINMDILYEYKLTLQNISQTISNEYTDMFCIFSPDCFGQIDIFFDTSNIEMEDTYNENPREIYLEEVVQPVIEHLSVCGIPGIQNMFFCQDKGEWFIETENTNEKVQDAVRYKKNTDKLLDPVGRFKKILAHPDVDATRTISNNIWDIYNTLGVEAVRQYMIDEFSKIMDGINTCHVALLVDKMTFTGTISSISRYTMRSEESGPFGKASFEETLDNFLKAGVFGQEEPTKGVSASIICGKRATVGTGLCELKMDIEKLQAHSM
jgi:DNA-directed RNA polymerase beta' subunit